MACKTKRKGKKKSSKRKKRSLLEPSHGKTPVNDVRGFNEKFKGFDF